MVRGIVVAVALVLAGCGQPSSGGGGTDGGSLDLAASGLAGAWKSTSRTGGVTPGPGATLAMVLAGGPAAGDFSGEAKLPFLPGGPGCLEAWAALTGQWMAAATQGKDALVVTLRSGTAAITDCADPQRDQAAMPLDPGALLAGAAAFEGFYLLDGDTLTVTLPQTGGDPLVTVFARQ